MYRHASRVAAMLVAVPALLAAQSTRQSPLPEAAIVSMTGNVHGTIPPAECFEAGRNGIVVRAFDETTAHGESGNLGVSGSFELEMETACVAPFFQALFAHEHVSTRVTFTGGAQRTPSSITLEDAQLTHVDLGLTAAAGRSLPLVTVGLSAAHVVSGDTSGSIVQAGMLERPRAHVFRAASPPGASASGADAWTRSGVNPVIHLAATRPLTDETSRIAGFHLMVAATASKRGGTSLRILLDSVVRADTPLSRSRHEWVEPHVLLNQAALLLNGQDGTTGITIWLKGAQIARVQTPGRSPTGNRRVSAFAISAARLTITDISSGRTASTP